MSTYRPKFFTKNYAIKADLSYVLLYIHIPKMIPSIKIRKKHTKFLIDCTQRKLFKLTCNDAISGYIIFIFHQIIVYLSLTYILIGEINWLFYLFFTSWIAAFNLHLYFNGCILTKIERSLWNTREWSGTLAWIFSPIDNTSVAMTPNLVNNIFICCGIVIFMVGFLRFLYSLN
jgi:hypothetical protein